MSAVTVRNLPEATHRALKLRAAQHGRSTEAEIRHILENVLPPKSAWSRPWWPSGKSWEALPAFLSDSRPVKPASFE